MNNRDFLVEIATTDFATTANAVAGGADRIELCTALSEGGITPSAGLVRLCREAFDLPIFPIIRPRPGDFLYSDEEFEIMLDDIHRFRELQCDGVVIGLLKKDGSLPRKKLDRLINAAYPMEVTFHRAFDRCVDPFEALEELIEAGCQRILTSGQQPTAPEGATLIRELVEKADGRIIIMPGSGVRTSNIKELAETTGATEFHTSLRGTIESRMEFRHPAFATSPESYSNPSIDEEAVRAFKKALHEQSR